MTLTKAAEDVMVEQIRDLLTRATPGPWLVVDNRHLNDAYWICAPDEFTSHAEVRSGSGEAEAAGDTLANAQLIALVPQMANAITTFLERERRLREALEPFARQLTVDEVLQGPDPWGDLTTEQRIAQIGERKQEVTDNIMRARAALTREGGMMAERVFDPVVFGRSIRILLAELNIQQREAARMIGVDKCVLNRICKHGNPPSVENYLRIVGWMNKVSQPNPDREV